MKKEVLKNIGFEDKEIDVYLALLELDESSVLMLAKWTDIKRPTVYVVLESLLNKGFVTKVIRGKKVNYLAQPPKRLETVAITNLEQIKSILPDLQLLNSSHDSNKPRILMFEGKSKLDVAYEDMFTFKGEVLYIGNLTAARDIFKESYKKLENISYNKEFSTRLIVDDTQVSRKYATENDKEFHQTRFIPKEMMPFDVDIGIYGNKIIITSVTENFFSVSIEDEKISKAFRTIFEIMWLQLR